MKVKTFHLASTACWDWFKVRVATNRNWVLRILRSWTPVMLIRTCGFVGECTPAERKVWFCDVVSTFYELSSFLVNWMKTCEFQVNSVSSFYDNRETRFSASLPLGRHWVSRWWSLFQSKFQCVYLLVWNLVIFSNRISYWKPNDSLEHWSLSHHEAFHNISTLFILFWSVSKESIVDVSATVSSVGSPIESCTMKMVELHVHEFWVVSAAKTHLPLLIEDASRRITEDEVINE